MGLFDFFSGKGGAFNKHAARAANKRAQNPDRWESIRALASMKTPEAVSALLNRFTVRVDPSIIDQEEKDLAFDGIVEAGDVAVEPVRAFMRSADSVGWPLKILERLLEPEEVVGELLSLLETMDTDYERDPEKKIQVIAYLEDRQDERVVDAVVRFLDDTNETVRFHAVGATWAQAEPDAAREELLNLVEREESVRIRARVFDGFVEREWKVPDDRRDAIRKQLPAGFALDSDGTPRKAG